MRRVLPLEPPDLVDLLLDLQTLQVVELRLVRLELCVEFEVALIAGIYIIYYIIYSKLKD